MLKLGVAHEQVALLRKRLDMAAESPDGTQLTETKFDEEVAEAVRRFQIAHGAVPDGAVGAGTRRLLNGGRPPHAGREPGANQGRAPQHGALALASP